MLKCFGSRHNTLCGVNITYLKPKNNFEWIHIKVHCKACNELIDEHFFSIINEKECGKFIQKKDGSYVYFMVIDNTIKEK